MFSFLKCFHSSKDEILIFLPIMEEIKTKRYMPEVHRNIVGRVKKRLSADKMKAGEETLC